jgi:hypothetical protein
MISQNHFETLIDLIEQERDVIELHTAYANVFSTPTPRRSRTQDDPTENLITYAFAMRRYMSVIEAIVHIVIKT